MDLATIVYVLVDDGYQEQGVSLLQGKVGAKPVLSDSEVITLLLLMDYLPYPGERQFLGFIRAHYLALFPQLLDQSPFNRRARGLRLLVEELRRHWAVRLGVTLATPLLLATKPIPVVGYKRGKQHSDFVGSATDGVCPSRHLKYFGYQRVLLSTWEGSPVVYELVPAHTEERIAADTVLSVLWHGDIFGDKGFLGRDGQQLPYDLQGNRIGTPKLIHQHGQNAPAWDRWLHGQRARMEGVFHEVQHTGRHRERLLRKTVIGLVTHVIAHMASHTLKLYLRRFLGLDVQTFTAVSAI